MNNFCKTLKENEIWLMERILSYAKAQGYTEYTSTLIEAWRVSIAGLSDAISDAYVLYKDKLPEFLPDERFEDDPVTQFGVTEARLHLKRGISLSMFLGLFKYYRYTFQDFIQTLDLSPKDRMFHHSFVERCLDRIEIAFCTQWSNLEGDKVIAELQSSNRLMTNEKNKYLTLFESLETPAFLVDDHGLIDNLNISAASLIGLQRFEGSTYYAVDKSQTVHRRHLSVLLPWLKEALDRFLLGTESSFRLELEETNEQGHKIYAAIFSRMKDVSGKFRGGIVLLDDVTERKKLELLKEDVERITHHDLKVPLSGILAVFNYLLEDESIDQDQKYMLSMGRDSGYNMLGMINKSLDLFKMEMGTYQFEPKSVDLTAVLRILFQSSISYTKGRGVTLSIEINGVDLNDLRSGTFLLAEEMLLHTALGNLLQNALEASPTGGNVKIAVYLNETCHISISNQGGVPKQIRDSFFEKYATWGKKSGTGLGTYSARLIIETMGGTISMSSDGSSTKISLELPLAV
jgi:signal transduction histidine kinase